MQNYDAALSCHSTYDYAKCYQEKGFSCLIFFSIKIWGKILNFYNKIQEFILLWIEKRILFKMCFC